MPPTPTHPDRLALASAEDRSVEQQMHLAYEQVVRRLEVEPLGRVEAVNVNVATLLLTVLGSVPRIAPHRATLASMPTFDIAQVDDLELLAYALGEAHSRRKVAAEASSQVAELGRLQRAVRRQLLSDAHTLATRGLLDRKRIAKVGASTSHLSVAFEVVGLVRLLLEHWPDIEGKCALTVRELEQARKGANQLVLALGRRQGPESEDDPEDRIYRQIFTWLNRAYADVRKALLFIRRKEGDANQIAPSAYRGRPKSAGKRSKTEAPSEATEPGEPAEGAATPLFPEHL